MENANFAQTMLINALNQGSNELNTQPANLAARGKRLRSIIKPVGEKIKRGINKLVGREEKIIAEMITLPIQHPLEAMLNPKHPYSLPYTIACIAVLRVLIQIHKYYGHSCVFPHLDTLAKLSGYSIGHVCTVVQILVGAGLISVVRKEQNYYVVVPDVENRLEQVLTNIEAGVYPPVKEMEALAKIKVPTVDPALVTAAYSQQAAPVVAKPTVREPYQAKPVPTWVRSSTSKEAEELAVKRALMVGGRDSNYVEPKLTPEQETAIQAELAQVRVEQLKHDRYAQWIKSLLEPGQAQVVSLIESIQEKYREFKRQVNKQEYFEQLAQEFQQLLNLEYQEWGRWFANQIVYGNKLPYRV